MAYKLVIVLTLHCLVHILYSKEHLVQNYCRSHSSSCRTFNDYANDADTYFSSDSSFNFMKGTHHLNVTVSITNVVNLSWVGDESDVILSNGCSIIWTNSSKLFWTSLNLIFNKTNEKVNSAVFFENSENVTFLNTSFLKIYCDLNFDSRVILVVGSSTLFERCKFENGYHFTGGALYIEDSNVTFGGHNVFFNNTAYNTAGAMYALNSKIQFSGNNTFMGNRAGMEATLDCDGTALHVEYSSVSLNGYFKFHNNQIIEICYMSLGGGAISASFSTIAMQGVFFFSINFNVYGGAILLHHSECLISGHVEFEGNEAFFNGGAIFLRDSECLINGHVVFKGNKAISNGGAISATYSSFIMKSNGFSLHNTSEYINSENSSSTSAYQKSIIFCNNSAGGGFGGAVYLLETSITLTGSVIFMANKALHGGGGISIDYTSDSRKCHPNFVIFQEPLDVLFFSNHAGQLGGALYVEDANSGCRQWNPYYYFNCFFTVSGSVNFIKLNFTGNKASEGTGIYGGAIQYCEMEDRSQGQTGYEVLQKLTKTSEIQKEYANDNAYEIRLCNDTTKYKEVKFLIFL